MLANVNRSLLLILLVVAFVVAVVVMVGGVIWALVKSKKGPSANSKRMILAFGSIVIAAVSWILNFGWLRFIMTLLTIPIIHGIVFFIANLFFTRHIDQSRKLGKLNLAFIITYLITYLLLPDGGDVGEMYFFFGLIRSNNLFGIASSVSSLAFMGNIILFVMQILEIIKVKKNKVESKKPEEGF